MALNAGTGALTGSSYGDLSKHDAFTIQKRMLPIAKRLLTFGKFAQKETKHGMRLPEVCFRVLAEQGCW